VAIIHISDLIVTLLPAPALMSSPNFGSNDYSTAISSTIKATAIVIPPHGITASPEPRWSILHNDVANIDRGSPDTAVCSLTQFSVLLVEQVL